MRGIDHRLLGNYLLEHEEMHPNALCRRMFLFGCIEPDINPFTYTRGSMHYRFLHGHNALNARRHLYKVIRRLQRTGVPTPMELFALGAVIHYTADSFTYVHNDLYDGDIHGHRVYEHTLHPLFVAYVDTYDSTAPIPEEAWDLEAYHDRYIAGEHSFMTDCRYILSATRMICHSVPELVTCPAKVVC